MQHIPSLLEPLATAGGGGADSALNPLLLEKLAADCCNECEFLLFEPWARAAGKLPGLPAAPLILNIGANEGSWALRVLRLLPEASVHSFELHPGTFAVLQGKRDKEPFAVQARWTVHNAAMGSSAGGVASVFGGSGSPVSNVRGGQETLAPENMSDTGLRVPAATVAAFLDSWSLPPPDFVQIDAEGNEGEVILGLDLHGHGHPHMIQFESGGTWHDSRSSGLTLQAVLLHLGTHGFECWLMGARALHPVDIRTAKAHGFAPGQYGTPNFLCVRRTSPYSSLVLALAAQTAEDWK